MADGFNVPSGEGLLGQQQEAAAKIPYENIAAGQASLKTALGAFLNTFHVASQMNSQRQKLEQALQVAHMKNDMDEREFGLKMDNMATRHAIAVASLQQRAAHQDDMLEMAGRGMQIREAGAELDRKKFDFTVDKQNDRIAGTEAILDVEKELGAEGITPESPNYFTEYSSRLNSRAAAAPASTFNKALSMAGKRVNDTSDRLQKDNIAKSNAFAEDVGRTIFGDPKFQDLRPVIDYKNLPDQPPPGQSWTDWIMRKPVPPSQATGNKVYTYATSAGDKQAVVSTKKLAELNKTYNDIMEERKRIPSKIPLGTYDSTEKETLRDRAVKIANDPNASSAAKAAAEKYLSQ